MKRLPAFDLRHLEILRALVETGTTTAAAQRLGMSQSAISRGIAQLEAELGRPLFDRQGGRLVPTVEAFAIHERLQPVFDVLTQIGDEDMTRPPSGVFRLSATPTLGHRFLPAHIASFVRRNPDVEINFHITSLDNLVASVVEERVDLGFADAFPTRAYVRSDVFLETEAVCLLPACHPLAARVCIEAQDLAGENFIAFTRNHSGRFAIDQVFDRASVTPRTVIETGTSVPACEFVREGLGIALLNPFPIAGQFGPSVVMRPFMPRIVFRTSFLTPSRVPISAAAAAFIAHTRASMDFSAWANLRTSGTFIAHTRASLDEGL